MDIKDIFRITSASGTPYLGVYPPISQVANINEVSLKNIEGTFSDEEFQITEKELLELVNIYDGKHKGFFTFRLGNVFKGSEGSSIFKDCRIRAQITLDPRYNYLISALCALGSQPGFLSTLINPSTISSRGEYHVLLNQNGKWIQVVIDDNCILYKDTKSQNLFFNSSPSPATKEIWHILLEKAFSKSLGGFKNIVNGMESNVLRDFTGAPCLTKQINQLNKHTERSERDVAIIRQFYKQIEKKLQKGMIVTLIPRAPTKNEREINIMQNQHPRKLGDGIYAGHSYTVINATTFVNSRSGEEEMVIKLRNPFYGEPWEGDWSYESDTWTIDSLTRPDCSREEDGPGQFWISASDSLQYFTHLNICKIRPGNHYTNITIPAFNNNLTALVVRFRVNTPGKYCISFNQKDEALMPASLRPYSAVDLSLGKLADNEITLLSFTHSNSLRNTILEKNLGVGEYWTLVEYSGSEDTVNLSIYGPGNCPMKLAHNGLAEGIHDYIMTEGWKNFYMERKLGIPIIDLKVYFAQIQQELKLSIEKLNIPSKHVFAFKNPHMIPLILHVEFVEITNFEFIGPFGKPGHRQVFILPPGGGSVFIMRGEDEEVTFQISNLIGEVSKGLKTPPEIIAAFNHMVSILPELPVESQNPSLSRYGLYARNGELMRSSHKIDSGIKRKEVIVRESLQIDEKEIKKVKGDTIQRTMEEHRKIVEEARNRSTSQIRGASNSSPLTVKTEKIDSHQAAFPKERDEDDKKIKPKKEKKSKKEKKEKKDKKEKKGKKEKENKELIRIELKKEEEVPQKKELEIKEQAKEVPKKKEIEIKEQAKEVPKKKEIEIKEQAKKEQAKEVPKKKEIEIKEQAKEVPQKKEIEIKEQVEKEIGIKEQVEKDLERKDLKNYNQKMELKPHTHNSPMKNKIPKTSHTLVNLSQNSKDTLTQSAQEIVVDIPSPQKQPETLKEQSMIISEPQTAKPSIIPSAIRGELDKKVEVSILPHSQANRGFEEKVNTKESGIHQKLVVSNVIPNIKDLIERPRFVDGFVSSKITRKSLTEKLSNDNLLENNSDKYQYVVDKSNAPHTTRERYQEETERKIDIKKDKIIGFMNSEPIELDTMTTQLTPELLTKIDNLLLKKLTPLRTISPQRPQFSPPPQQIKQLSTFTTTESTHRRFSSISPSPKRIPYAEPEVIFSAQSPVHSPSRSTVYLQVAQPQIVPSKSNALGFSPLAHTPSEIQPKDESIVINQSFDILFGR